MKLRKYDGKFKLIFLSYSFRVSELLDYTAEDMTGMSLYALCHGEDVHKLKSTHEDCKCTKKF